MLSEIFKALLITSLAGSCLAAVIALAKPLTKRFFGYAWHYYIWLAVLAVMVLPVRFNLPQKAEIPPVTAVQTTETGQTDAAANNADNAAPIIQKKPNALKSGTIFIGRIFDNKLNILAVLWLVGALVFWLINLIGYIRLIIKMRKNSVVVPCPELANFTDKRVAVRVWENTSSPFMTGIFKPTLVLPERELTEEQLNNILRHEITHFKRHDILYKWFVSLVKCLHWFNPVIWYMSAQINTECEISCDMAAVQNMNGNEEMSYINTILSLLHNGRSNKIPLTTQMASSKRVLKRRFTMIRNKRKTSKFVSALSAVIAVVMLGTTVFASGVLSELTTDDYTVEITNNGEKIELNNKPFVENREVYVPLRELLEKVCDYENTCKAPSNRIIWNDGQIRIEITYEEYDPEIDNIHIYTNNYGIEIGNTNFIDPTHPGPNDKAVRVMRNAPVLRNGNTYIPYSYIREIFNIPNQQKWKIGYVIRNKNGILVDLSGNNLKVGTIMVDENNKVVFKSDDLKNPESTINGFFEAFADSNFTLMKNYCTAKCQGTFFGNGYCFGMTKASLQSISKNNDDLKMNEFTAGKWSAMVDVNMTPHEQSVFDPSQTETSFYVILERQSDGRYLIDEFATGL